VTGPMLGLPMFVFIVMSGNPDIPRLSPCSLEIATAGNPR
jgi:hypothetical protein